MSHRYAKRYARRAVRRGCIGCLFWTLLPFAALGVLIGVFA